MRALVAAPRPSPLLKVDSPLAAVQALGHAVVRGQRARGLHFGCVEEGVMAVHRQWALPFSVDALDPQLPVVTGHVGGARGVHMQSLRVGTSLCAAASNVFVVFCREENKEKVIELIYYLHKGIQHVRCTHLTQRVKNVYCSHKYTVLERVVSSHPFLPRLEDKLSVPLHVRRVQLLY